MIRSVPVELLQKPGANKSGAAAGANFLYIYKNVNLTFNKIKKP